MHQKDQKQEETIVDDGMSLCVKWKRKEHSYSKEDVQLRFQRYGKVDVVVLKRPGMALVVFADKLGVVCDLWDS